jgi:hypothetical protein
MNGRTLGFIALLVIIGLIVARFLMKPYEPEPTEPVAPLCDWTAAQEQVKNVYFLGSLYPDELAGYVRHNFLDAETMACFADYCNDFGSFLTRAGYQAFPANDLRERANAIASEAGRPDMGPDVYQGMVESSLDLVQLGHMIQEFPDIVRGLRKGDVTAYQQSGMGQMNILLTRVMDPSLKFYVDQVIDAQRPHFAAFVDEYLDMLMIRHQVSS